MTPPPVTNAARPCFRRNTRPYRSGGETGVSEMRALPSLLLAGAVAFSLYGLCFGLGFGTAQARS